jgi:hypothetical protein
MKTTPSLLLCLLGASPLSAQLAWTTETIVVGANAVMPALAQGASHTAGVAYFDTAGFVNYASRSAGGVWTTNTAIEDRGSFNFLGLSVKLTAAGDPRIGFFTVNGFDGRYASRTAGVWTVENIATTGAAGEYVHLGLASDGTPRAAYGSNSNSLNYASRATGSWVTENLTTNGIPSFLRLGAGDVPFIAFVDSQGTGDLRIASNPTGSNWVYSTAVSGFSGTASTLSFRLNGSDAAVSWVDSGALMLARSTGGVWSTQTVVASGVSNAGTSLALDGAGNGYIAYNLLTGGVGVASYNGTAWVSDTFGSGALSVAQGESLDLLNGRLALTYTSGSDLMYSYASVSAVPEPSTYAAIAGGGVLGLAVWRRRRSRAGGITLKTA